MLAGAGTGKTRVVTSRIAHMIDEGIKPDSILAVTFTNKAATEMRERVAGVVKKVHAELVTVSTFHSLCVKILRTSIVRLGYRKNFSIYTGSDQMGLIRKILAKPSIAAVAGDGGSPMDPFVAVSLISKIKSSGKEVPMDSQEPIAPVYRMYQHELKMHNAVDFDDLLILAEQALRENEDIRLSWQHKFRYIMVDEFQDTNRLQMELLRNLVDKKMNVCVVGDDDQSIYGWRGAEISNILDFERFFPNPHVVKMEQNYRSTTPILHTANSLIRHNIQRREKSLWSDAPGRDPVRLVGMPGEKEEAELIVEEIKEIRMGEKRSWDDFAILFRTNAQTRVFETELRENDIPYRMIGGQSFYDRKEVKDLMSYLAVIVNQDDDVNMLRIINNPPRGIGDTTIVRVTDEGGEQERSIYSMMNDDDFLVKLTKRGRAKVEEFTDLLERYIDSMTGDTADFPTVFEKLLEEMDFIDYLKRGCKTDKEADMRRENVHELIGNMRYFQSKRKKKRSLRNFLDNVALSQQREQDDLDKKSGVTLITLHAAKGLEYPLVYLVGLEDGILPHKRSIEEGTRDEERRLLYVGITRAKERLMMSYCIKRKKYGTVTPCVPSSFIPELDKKYLEEMSYDEIACAPVEEDQAADYFAQMKAMLSDE
ncbi:MAG: DNA helicase-2/ATP-dependent DNA helicase PcrA [Verrucomicrobiales bacterium]